MGHLQKKKRLHQKWSL